MPLNGNLLLATDGTNTRASFSCDEGFTLKGATEIVCNNVGEWNDQEPVCGMMFKVLSEVVLYIVRCSGIFLGLFADCLYI